MTHYIKNRAQPSRFGYAAARTGLRHAAACIAILALSACTLLGNPSPFDPAKVPPPPDYSQPSAWLAFPGRHGLERSTPAGVIPMDESQARADVFFIPPTTYKGSDVLNAPYDASNAAAPLYQPVLVEQASVFNGCCRIFAPRYRQASLAGLKNPTAVALAYSDVARAFRYYIAHENHGRPFIIASHSQGTTHAVRLLQQEILRTPLQKRMIAGYLIGGYVPDNFASVGLPTCNQASQTGCVLSYNASQTGRTGARILIDHKTYWWQGTNVTQSQPPAVCVNPLSWKEEGVATAELNAGSLPFPRAPFTDAPRSLHVVTHLTGAVCVNGLLDVDISSASPPGFRDKLSFFSGSYHLNDYGIFYASLRQNARDRTNSWLTSHSHAVRPTHHRH